MCPLEVCCGLRTERSVRGVLALEFFDPFAELHDFVILVDLWVIAFGEGVLVYLLVLLRSPLERRVLAPELPRKADGTHLAVEDYPRCRYLELLIITLPLLGDIECLSPLTWCSRNLALST